MHNAEPTDFQKTILLIYKRFSFTVFLNYAAVSTKHFRIDKMNIFGSLLLESYDRLTKNLTDASANSLMKNIQPQVAHPGFVNWFVTEGFKGSVRKLLELPPFVESLYQVFDKLPAPMSPSFTAHLGGLGKQHPASKLVNKKKKMLVLESLFYKNT